MLSPHWTTAQAPVRPRGSGATPSGAAMRQAVTAMGTVLARDTYVVAEVRDSITHGRLRVL
jgi:hypothetical protein